MINNNKGVTLAEVLVSIVLIAIVVLFLFRLLLLLRNDDVLNDKKADVQIVGDTIINAFQNDAYGLGVEYIYLSKLSCDSSFPTTNLCCTQKNSKACLKIFYSSKQVKELSIYDSNGDGKNDSIKYYYTNKKLPDETYFIDDEELQILRTKEYKSNYRFDTLTKVVFPIGGLDDSYNITITVPSVYLIGSEINEDLFNMCKAKYPSSMTELKNKCFNCNDNPTDDANDNC